MKCKYPESVCVNMTKLHGIAYCDSVPCSLRGELPPMTNADRIRAMSNKELANWLCHLVTECDTSCPGRETCKFGHTGIIDWLQKPAEEDT